MLPIRSSKQNQAMFSHILVLWAFINLIPSSKQVSLFPPGPLYTSVPGRNVTFACIPSRPSILIVWLINGSQLGNNADENIMANENLGIGTLTFFHIEESNNNTIIQCQSVFNAEIISSSNIVSLLLLSGRLSAVRSLNATVENNTISLTWTPPQNVQSIYKVTYCVDFVNATSTLSSSLHSVCNITETEFNYLLPTRSWCDVYFISVTPVNAFGNGTRHTIRHLLVQSPPIVRNVIRLDNNTIQIRTMIMSERVCKGEVTFVDLNTGETSRIGGADLSISENNITFNTEQLTVNRHYYVIVTASNIAGSNTSHTSISTHAVTNIVLRMDPLGEIQVTALYSEHSSASGALFSFVFITESGDVDFTRSALLPLDRNSPPSHTLPFNLYPGYYRIYVYDIEQDGTLYNGVGYPAVSEKLFTSANGQGPPSFVNNCQIDIFPGVIMAACALPHGTLQVIAQLIDVSEVHKLYVNQSMDLQTPVTVQVERNGAYWVTIFTIMEGEWDVVYTEQVVVGDESTTHNITSTTNSTGQPDLVGLLFALVGCIIVVVGCVLCLVTVVFINGHRLRKKSSMRHAKYQENRSITKELHVLDHSIEYDYSIEHATYLRNENVVGNRKREVYSKKENYDSQTKEEEKHEEETKI